MDYSFLSKTTLFKGHSESEIESVLNCLAYSIRSFHKDEVIYHTGDQVNDVGLILSGSVQIESINILGDKSILGIFSSGEVFAESYACTPNTPIMVDVLALEKSEILFINIPSIFSENSICHHGTKILQNLLQISSEKNLTLSMRIFHTAPKTIRARLLSFFSEQTNLQKSMHITIPMNRQQLADYLGVDRTALSKELSKMKEDGLLDYRKNEFTIKVTKDIPTL